MNIDLKDKQMSAYSFPITISLSSTKTTGVYDLETGYLQFRLFTKKANNLFEVLRYHGAAYSGGNYRIMTYQVQDGLEHVYEELPQNKLLLSSDSSLHKTYDYRSLFGCYPWSGEYKMTVEYEGQLITEKEFSVEFDYEKAVEKLLTYLESNSFCDESSTLNANYYLLAYPREKHYYGPDSLHYQQAPVLRTWWEEHKELILKIETVLNQEQYKAMLYEDRVPELLKNLEKSDYQKRLESRDELYEILGLPEWKPSASDTEEKIQARVKELSDWWEANKELINRVNRVILENKLD